MNILTPDGDKFCRVTAMSQSSSTRSTASCKTNHETYRVSGAKTNSKVGGGHRSRAKRRKNFFGRVPPHFGPKSIISRFGKRFRDGQYSLVSFLFAVLLLTVPPGPAICKSARGYMPPCFMESAPLYRVVQKKYATTKLSRNVLNCLPMRLDFFVKLKK